jgi:Tfp pilus assembly protein PilV
MAHFRHLLGCRDRPKISENRCATATPRRAPRWTRRDGFSITEVIVSVMVVSIGVIAFATAVGLAARDIRLGQRHTDIAMLVTDQMEQLKSLPPHLVQNGQRDEGDYQLTWTVSGGNPTKVVLVVQYPGLKTGVRTDTLVTYMPR